MALAPSISEVLVASNSIVPDPERPNLVLVDKPKGLSSFAVVKQVRRLLGVKRVGHSGTLDPMATGLLIVMVGRATKLMDQLLSHQKVYTGVMKLGEVTDSYDAETPVTATVDASGVTDESIQCGAQSFVGDIIQETPMYSAVKVGGERLYRKARRGESSTQPKRIVTVYTFDIESRIGEEVSFKIVCSTGTYIRSIAHDLGTQLGVGAHLTALRRTRIGDYAAADAWNLDELRAACELSGSKVPGQDDDGVQRNDGSVDD